jgi:hypothetical protein
MSSPEVQPQSGERGREATDAAGERLKELSEQLEKKGEQSPEKSGERAESARKEAEAAFSKERGGREAKSGGEPSAAPRRAHATKHERRSSYNDTMKQIQSEMKPSERSFSKVIHAPSVEKTSEVVGSTIARPNAILAGAVAATFLSLAVYLIAKHYGYRLSGFETIGTFAVGWALGLLYDYAHLMLRTSRR